MTDEEIKYILLNAKRLNIKECNARDLLFARYRELKELVDKQQKEIEFYEIQELEYIQGYEDGKRHEQTAVAIKNENAQYELIQREIEKLEDKNKTLEDKNKTLEQLLQGNLYEMYKYYRELANSYQANCISKDKIKEKIEELKNRKIGASTGIFAVQVDILEELLGE